MDFPPWQTVYGWFRQWKRRGVTERILTELREQIRLAEGRDAEPSAGVIDSQSVRGADTVGKGSRGYDADKKTSDAEVQSSLAPSVGAAGGEAGERESAF